MRIARWAVWTFVSILEVFAGSDAIFAFGEPYCGIYSMNAALHSLGISADFDGMVDSQYLTGALGSTADDLMRLAQKHGAAASFQTNLTISSLRAANSPIILHTSIAVAKVGYHHWICFLGIDGDEVKIYDPPSGFHTISTAELLTYWDGIGVVVQVLGVQPAARTINLELILAFLSIVIVGGLLIQTLGFVRYRVLGIFLCAAVSALSWHLMVGYGFIRNPYALATVSSGHFEDSTEVIDFKRFEELLNTESVTIIDARRPLNYSREHVPGAINLPITVTHGFLRETLDQIPLENHIVVYCQSEKCTWADSIARQFTARNREHVSVFRGGIDGYKLATASAESGD